MNKTIRKALLAVMLSVLTAAMSACDSAAEQISGDWTVKTVNGKTPSDFASDNGVFELGTAKNYHFTDKDVTVSAVDETGAVISKTFDTKPTDNGLEILASGSTITLDYIEADNQIRYSVKQNDIQYQYILKRGSTDLAGLLTVKADRGAASALTDSSTVQDQ